MYDLFFRFTFSLNHVIYPVASSGLCHSEAKFILTKLSSHLIQAFFFFLLLKQSQLEGLTVTENTNQHIVSVELFYGTG